MPKEYIRVDSDESAVWVEEPIKERMVVLCQMDTEQRIKVTHAQAKDMWHALGEVLNQMDSKDPEHLG